MMLLMRSRNAAMSKSGIKAIKTGQGFYHDGSRPKGSPDFKSTVFKDEFELLDAYGPLARNAYKTMVKMNGIMVEVDRQAYETEHILRQQQEAQAKIDKHYQEGGSDIELDIPDWMTSADPMTNKH